MTPLLLLLLPLALCVQASISVPGASTVQCSVATITWTSPYAGTVTIWLHYLYSQYYVETIGQFLDSNSSYAWLVDVPAGMTFQLGMHDAADEEYWSDGFTIKASNDTACLGMNSGFNALISSQDGGTAPRTFSVPAEAASTLSSQQTTTSGSTHSPSITSAASSSSLSSSVTLTVAPSSTAAPSSTLTSTLSSSSSPNIGAIAGGSIGGALALTLLLALLFVVLRQQRRIRAAAEATRAYDMSAYVASAPPPAYRPVAPPSEEKALARSGIRTTALYE